MQAVSPGFTSASIAPVRSPKAKAEVSWTKDYTGTSGIFTIGVSVIGGTDIIPGAGYVPNDFGLFDFEDDTDRTISVQVDRFLNEPTSVARAAADIVFNNTDQYFDRDGGSAIQGLVTVGKPVRISFGFGSEYVNLFNGVISDYPTFNFLARTVEVFALDLIELVSGQFLTAAISLTNVTVDQVLTAIFDQLGIVPANCVFGVGVTVIPSVELDTATLIGTIINDLMLAEGGYLWADETGKFRFLPRNTNPYADPGFSVDPYVIDAQDLISTYIYNTCRVGDGDTIQSVYTDDDSVAQFGPQPLEITSPYIQTQAAADSLAFLYVRSNSSLETFHVLSIVGIPQLQLGDIVSWRGLTYVIIRIKTNLGGDIGLRQEITIKRYTLVGFFTIGVSIIGGPDFIAP